MPEFKDMLKYFRMREGLSQGELAAKLGVSASRISMYEVGKREPDFETEEKIADFFNTDLNTLRGRDIENKEPAAPIMNFYNQLNNAGKAEATKRVEELTFIPRYKNEIPNFDDIPDTLEEAELESLKLTINSNAG